MNFERRSVQSVAAALLTATGILLLSRAPAVACMIACYPIDMSTRGARELKLQKAWRLAERREPADPMAVAGALEELGDFYAEVEETYDHAELWFRRAVWIRLDTFGPESDQYAEGLRSLARYLEGQAADEERAHLLRTIIAIESNVCDPEDVGSFWDRSQLARLHESRGDWSQAEAIYRNMLDDATSLQEARKAAKAGARSVEVERSCVSAVTEVPAPSVHGADLPASESSEPDADDEDSLSNPPEDEEENEEEDEEEQLLNSWPEGDEEDLQVMDPDADRDDDSMAVEAIEESAEEDDAAPTESSLTDAASMDEGSTAKDDAGEAESDAAAIEEIIDDSIHFRVTAARGSSWPMSWRHREGSRRPSPCAASSSPTIGRRRA